MFLYLPLWKMKGRQRQKWRTTKRQWKKTNGVSGWNRASPVYAAATRVGSEDWCATQRDVPHNTAWTVQTNRPPGLYAPSATALFVCSASTTATSAHGLSAIAVRVVRVALAIEEFLAGCFDAESVGLFVKLLKIVFSAFSLPFSALSLCLFFFFRTYHHSLSSRPLPKPRH